MVIAVGLGIILLFLKDMNWKAGWLHMKLTLAFILIVTDLIFGFQCLSEKRVKGSKGGIFAIVLLCLVGILACIYLLKATVS